MADRWQSRAEPRADQGKLYWHVLLRDQPRLRALASLAQERLARFSGLHFTPIEWLHVTTLVVGFSEEFTAAEIDGMASSARMLLARLKPIAVTFGKVLYHSEAIAIGVRPQDALDPVRNAVWRATSGVVGDGKVLDDQPWNPHFTVAYSTAVQPAGPIIDALGRELPGGQATVSRVSLVLQRGAERLWDWRTIAEADLGGP